MPIRPKIPRERKLREDFQDLPRPRTDLRGRPLQQDEYAPDYEAEAAIAGTYKPGPRDKGTINPGDHPDDSSIKDPDSFDRLRPRSLMPRGGTLSPKGDLGALRMKESKKVFPARTPKRAPDRATVRTAPNHR